MQTQNSGEKPSDFTFKGYILGKTPRRVYYASLISTFALMMVTILIAYLLYDGEYSMHNKQISELDHIGFNPIGAYIFEVGFILSGLFFIPSAMFMMQTMQQVNRPLGLLGGFFYVVAGMGIIVVGCFPTRRVYIMHVVGAGMGFGGLLLAIIISLILVFVKARKMKKDGESSKKLVAVGIIAYVPFIVAALLAIIFVGIPVIKSVQGGMAFGEYTPEGWEIYEWGMFFTGLFSTLGTQRIF
jgi:hypothetical protein